MGNPYVSSIINKYGDMDKVSRDSAVIYDIINRQGTTLLIDCIAEHIGRVARDFKFHWTDSQMTKIAIVDELSSAIDERV